MFWNRWLGHGQWEQKLDAELRFHIDQQIEDLIRQGLHPAEARRRALLNFGGVEQIKEECRDSRSLAFQQAAYGLQLSDQLVNFPHRGSGNALKQ